MFIQVIEGKVQDRDAARRQLDRWVEELGPGAAGWLGSTAGVAADGTFFATARFESEEAARANSERPEQGTWWEAMSAVFDGEATFLDCPTVDTMNGGGSDEAGFVQVIHGRADRDQVLAEGQDLDEFFARVRPDVLGETAAWPGDGSFVQIVYFSSEAAAREGERAEPSPDDAERFNRLVGLMPGERYIDLADPWLYTA